MSARTSRLVSIFFFNDTATTEIYTLSLHDALPIWRVRRVAGDPGSSAPVVAGPDEPRSEEHTSELQSRRDLVCRLLLEKKKKKLDRTRRPRRSDIPYSWPYWGWFRLKSVPVPRPHP